MAAFQYRLQQGYGEIAERRNTKHLTAESQRRRAQTPSHQQHQNHGKHTPFSQGHQPAQRGMRQQLADQEAESNADHHTRTDPQSQAQQKGRGSPRAGAIRTALAPENIAGDKQ